MKEYRFWCPQCKQGFQENEAERREVDTMFGDGRWWHCLACGSSLVPSLEVHHQAIENDDFLAYTLSDLLTGLGESALNSFWLCTHVEAYGQNTGELDRYSDREQLVAGQGLLRAISDVDNIVDGYFSAYHYLESKPWLIVRAIDNEIFESESHGPDVQLFKQTYRKTNKKGTEDEHQDPPDRARR